MDSECQVKKSHTPSSELGVPRKKTHVSSSELGTPRKKTRASSFELESPRKITHASGSELGSPRKITLASSSELGTLRARFADLAWEIGRYVRRKQKDAMPSSASSTSIPVELAYRAIDAYLEIVSQSLFDDEFEAWQFLDRAIELAHSINDRDRCLKAKAALLQLQHSAEASNPAYVLWRFDEIAWNRANALNFSDAEKQCLIDILERGLARRVSLSDKTLFDPHAAMDIADRLQRRRTQRGEKAEAQRSIKTAGAAFEDAAKSADALLASAWLEDLIPRYRNEGLNDDVARIEAAIRSRADEAAGEMKKIEVPLSIPKEKLNQWAEQVAGSAPEEAFRRLAAAGLIREEAARKSAQAVSYTHLRAHET